MIRREFIFKTLSLPALSVASSTFAQSGFPAKPITLIVPWPAGASTDIASRALAEILGRELGQSVVVDNKPGASGAIGSTLASKARADGYTLLTTTADTHSINPQVRSDLQYDAVNGFVPLVGFGTVNWVWMARADFPAQNIKELVAYARQNPGKVSYGTWGVGSTAHIAGALLENAAGIQLNHVPFQGGAPAAAALQGGHLDILPYLKPPAADMRMAGKAKILGYAAQQRSPNLLSDVPTLMEQGVAGAESGTWYGIMAPKGIPEDVRTRLTTALVKVLGKPDTASRILAAGIDPMNLSGTALNDFIRNEYQRYGAIVRQRNIRVD